MSDSVKALLTPQQISELKGAFDIFDEGRSGTIDSEDFQTLLKMFGLRLTEQEISQLLQEIDQDESGRIEFDKLLSVLATNMQETTIEEQMTEAYGLLDRDGKGYINSDDLRRVMGQLGEAGVTLTDATALMRNALDGRDKVTRREFMIMLKMHGESPT
ncbi:calmodulin, putative [Perkinsus marinus ATCC 50983]|uniref:Calmodulin n=1 Tax=Perkinsus marinus (strain ATCC 50983 / TXsc) TaxID=423536 RepID=C5KUI1_PERM5|nr:calmodulin, putative [Perkinsus marinus ATCC 50983]EER11868.1 calmodulin, putative [Perkinsus marinus ATCC 50983]|eukprot:XP_002780073.1 calmodulin, putative [Perkinsus marinus ATCC 50983]